MVRWLVASLSLFGIFALACAAQTQDSTGASSAVAKPAAGEGSNAQSNAATEKKKPKKVWTNEEIGSVSGSISVVGDASKTGNEGSVRNSGIASGQNDLRKRQIENYRDQIRQLQGQIEAADKRIAQLKNFKGENTTPAGGINPNRGYNMVPVDEQVKQLEDKKKQLRAKIDNVENEARKNDIEPGEIR